MLDEGLAAPEQFGPALPWGRTALGPGNRDGQVVAKEGGSRWKLHGAGLRYLPAFLASEYNDGWRE